jgi:HSP20 family protein
MAPLRELRSHLERGVVRAWGSLAEGWRQLLSRSSGALTQFASGAGEVPKDSPTWGLLPGEAWETAQSVIIRVELPGMSKEDIDVSIHGNLLRVRGDKRSEGEHAGRTYHVMERAFGSFERVIALPARIVEESAEVTCKDGVITVILRKPEPTPPRPLTVR